MGRQVRDEYDSGNSPFALRITTNLADAAPTDAVDAEDDVGLGLRPAFVRARTHYRMSSSRNNRGEGGGDSSIWTNEPAA